MRKYGKFKIFKKSQFKKNDFLKICIVCTKMEYYILCFIFFLDTTYSVLLYWEQLIFEYNFINFWEEKRKK